MALNAPYTILGTDLHPKLQFYHEFVNSRNDSDNEDTFEKLHTQSYYEMSFFVSGNRKIKVENTVYNFSDGDLFIVKPEQKHGGSPSHGTLDRYRLHIWPDAFDSLPDKDGIFDIFSKIETMGNKFTLSEKQLQLVYGYLSNIDNCINLGAPQTKKISSLAEIFKLLALIRNILYDSIVYPTKNPQLLNILSYIASSYDTVTTDDIEKQFSISHSTLWRLFSKEMNISPYAYILEIKLKKAILLLSQDIDVQTISDMCGFCDCSYFIKKFKEKYGDTPNQLRKQLP